MTRRRSKPRKYHRVSVPKSTDGFSVIGDPTTGARAEVTFPIAARSRTGPKPRAGTTSTETLRFRCSEAEAAEILDACRARRRDMSDVARDLLLAWARGGER